jgi:hypothetical protein
MAKIYFWKNTFGKILLEKYFCKNTFVKILLEKVWQKYTFGKSTSVTDMAKIYFWKKYGKNKCNR